MAAFGKSFLDLDGLNALWTRIKELFAPKSHASSATTYGVGTTANYGHVKIENNSPLTVGTTNTDGVATGKAHIHNAIESVARNSVTTADLDHIYTSGHAHMILSQISGATSTTHDPGDGYVLSFMWDNSGAYDAQLFIAASTSDDSGRLKVRYRNNASWGDWGYMPTASSPTLLTSSNNLNDIIGIGTATIAGYQWRSTSCPTNRPMSSDSYAGTMLVFQTEATNWTVQLVIRANSGVWQRRLIDGTWGSWEKVLVSGDVSVPSTVPTLAWNTESTLATIDGKNVKVKMPANPNSNTIPSAYCETAAGTAAKTASCTKYTATENTYLHVLMRYANSSAGALTLNVNGQGAKPIYINGAVSSSSNYTLPAGTYIAYYDGTNYWLRTDGRLQAGITGTAGFADAVYNRSNQTGDGWFKLAETGLYARTHVDNTAIWDVAIAGSGGGIYYEKICLDVRFNGSGDGVVSRFVRTYEVDCTASVKFAVLVSGQGGSGNTQVQLWAWQTKEWRGISIRQAAGNNWSLSKYNNSAWTYYSGDTGGTSKPVADAANHISVTDSTNVHMRAASFISSGTLPVARGGTGMSTATNKNAVVIGNSTTVTDPMQTVRTASGAFYATAQDAKPQFGTLPTAQGGTGATTRLGALKNLTDENVGTSAQYFLTITTSWGKGGYTSVADAKTVLGLKSAAYMDTGTSGTTVALGNHAHGSITNGGAITDTAVALASGDSLAFVDSSDSSKIKKTSITFDGSTATKALTQKGTWETFNNYSLPLAASGTRGGIQIGYSESGTNYAVKLSSEKAYVTVPWTDTKQNITLATTTKAFITGVSTTPTGTAQALTGLADTGVYLTTTAGELNATQYKVNEHCTMKYNSTKSSLDFTFS